VSVPDELRGGLLKGLSPRGLEINDQEVWPSRMLIGGTAFDPTGIKSALLILKARQ